MPLPLHTHCVFSIVNPDVTAVISVLLCVQLQKAEASEADEVDEEPAVVQSAQVFAPKSLVLVSRLDYTEAFRVRHTHQLQILHHFCIFCGK